MDPSPPPPPSSSRVWHAHHITFADPADAQRILAEELAPALTLAHANQHLDTWWYQWKPPGLRLRYQIPVDTGPTCSTDHATTTATVPADPLATTLRALAARGLVRSTAACYEPETLAFGGPVGMDLAHALFHADSRHSIAGARGHLGARERTALLISAMLRSAGLDWFEQGDTWAKVGALREPVNLDALPADRLHALRASMRLLLTADLTGHDELLPATWTAAYTTAGRALARLAQDGRLDRGLRAVAAHHVLFAANRARLPGREQALLAALAVDIVFRETRPRHDPTDRPPARHISPITTARTDTRTAR